MNSGFGSRLSKEFAMVCFGDVLVELGGRDIGRSSGFGTQSVGPKHLGSRIGD